MEKKKLVFVALLVLLCLGTVSVAQALPPKFQKVDEVVVSETQFIGETGIQPGWYSIAPVDSRYTKASIYDFYSLDVPVLVADYAWKNNASTLQKSPEEYVVPLLEGMMVIAGEHGKLSYNLSAGYVTWDHYEECGSVRLKYIAPLNASMYSTPTPTARPTNTPTARPTNTPSAASKSYLLYEDENIAISYSDVYVKKLGTSSYLMTEFMFKNKTDRIICVSCNSVIVNGCAVDISKFVDVPANCTFLNEWTNSAEMYLKYGIDEIETFSMVFNYNDSSSIYAGKKIQTVTINVK